MATVQHTNWQQRLQAYYYLCRFDKPIGTELVLWPTMWALWIAAKGFPDLKTFIVMFLGVIFMRAAGCAINDFADRKVDGHVAHPICLCARDDRQNGAPDRALHVCQRTSEPPCRRLRNLRAQRDEKV